MLISRRRKKVLTKPRSKRRFFRCLILALPVLLWLGYHEIKSQFQQPQAILVLGGEPQREKFAATFARQYPALPIWISSGSPKWYAERVFTKAGIDQNRLHLDYRAVDTVTNFTTLVDEFKANGIDKIYLITSQDHMRRAQIIGEIVLGSRGIDFKPISIPSNRAPESIDKAIRDGARAVLWVATGYTGSSLNKNKLYNKQ